MKILLLIFGNAHIEKISEIHGHTCIVKTVECEEINYYPELKKSAKFAEEHECEIIAVLPPKLQPDDLIPLLKAMPDDNLPTSLVTSFSPYGQSNLNNDSRIITTLQLLTGEQIFGFCNDLRIYPVKLISNLPSKFFHSPFAYLKILINASRAGYKIISAESSSDNLQFIEKKTPPATFLAGELLKSLTPFVQKRLSPRNFQKEKLKELLLHPKSFLKYLLKENATPGALAMAAGVGMFIGTLPIFSLHTVTIIYISIKLRLNKMLSVNMQHLCIPPFIPIACIEIGHYMLHGRWLKTASVETMFKEINSRILEWVLGSLILAPINALLFAGITYVIAIVIRSQIKTDRSPVQQNNSNPAGDK